MVSGGCIVGIGLYLVGVSVCLRCLDVSEGLSGCSSLAEWRIYTVLT